MTNYLKCILFYLLVFPAKETCFSKTVPTRHLINADHNINVGIKVSDSSGVVTIGLSQIQSNIISAIPLLNGMTITGEQPVLMVTPITAYIIFKTTKAGNEQMNVAVELEMNNSSLSFDTANGREIHVCKAFGNCNNCAFIKTGNRIITCNCKEDGGSSQNESGCQHTSTWLR